MSKIIGAVEIGTSKAKALVGEVTENGKLSIVGMASRPNEGMRKGEIVDFRKAADAVHASLEEAEKMSGHHGRFRLPCSNRYSFAWSDAFWVGLGQFL